MLARQQRLVIGTVAVKEWMTEAAPHSGKLVGWGLKEMPESHQRLGVQAIYLKPMVKELTMTRRTKRCRNWTQNDKRAEKMQLPG